MQRLAIVILTLGVCFSLLSAEDENQGTPGQTALKESPVQKPRMVTKSQAAIMSGNRHVPRVVTIPKRSALISSGRRNEARMIIRAKGQPKITLFKQPGKTGPDRKTPNDSAMVPGARKHPPSVDPGCLAWVDPAVDPGILIPVDKSVDPDMIIDLSPSPKKHVIRLPNTYHPPGPDSLDLPLRPWNPDSGQ